MYLFLGTFAYSAYMYTYVYMHLNNYQLKIFLAPDGIVCYCIGHRVQASGGPYTSLAVLQEPLSAKDRITVLVISSASSAEQGAREIH